MSDRGGMAFSEADLNASVVTPLWLTTLHGGAMELAAA